MTAINTLAVPVDWLKNLGRQIEKREF
jgi:hypothetical protein